MKFVRLSVALALMGMMASLVAVAYASPPDPSWIHGIYDDGDHDSVAIRISGTAELVEPFPLDRTCSDPPVVPLLPETDENPAPSEALPVIHARAPPAF